MKATELGHGCLPLHLGLGRDSLHSVLPRQLLTLRKAPSPYLVAVVPCGCTWAPCGCRTMLAQHLSGKSMTRSRATSTSVVRSLQGPSDRSRTKLLLKILDLNLSCAQHCYRLPISGN